MLAFYGDGSGEHGKGPFVVAGYLANTLDWFEVERDWDRVLKDGRPINYFKAREAILRQHRGGVPDYGGQFSGWSEEDVKAKCLSLANVIDKHCHRMVAIGSTLRWDDYHSVIGDDATKKVFYTPYLICINGALNEALKRSTEQFKEHPGRIGFVFDTEGAQLDVDAEQHFRLNPPTIPPAWAARCGSITFDSDITFPMLQLADFLAWSLRAEKEGLPSPWLDTIFRNPRIGGAHEARWNPAKLAQIVVSTDEEFHRMFPEGFVQP